MATDQEKLIDLKTSSKGDGSRYEATNVDIIENCTVYCRIRVQDRKGPLKVYINYVGLKGQNEITAKQAKTQWSKIGETMKK